MHLQHKIPWNELVQCLRTDDTEIRLPVGECGKIHLVDKATKIKVSSRKFLTDDNICTSSACSNTTNLRSFSKNKLSQPTLSACPRRQIGWRKDKLKFINEKFYETVMEFVASEERKFVSISSYGENEIIPESELLHMRCTECYRHPCNIGKVNIRNALCSTYGGQAVGNGYMYLVIHHLLPFYVRANAIIACGYESDENKWGDLQTNAHFRRSIEYDNDFLTFIPSLRKYLHKDTFMKDMNQTMELLRIVFRHIYVYIFLIKRFDCYRDVIKHDLKVQWHFGFRDFD
ncbi:hypothetical protein Bhyg_04534, partial [Pseudolycoriella hygida]